METKIWGLIVSILGVAGLVAAVIIINTAGAKHLEILFAGGILGTIAFFAGIRMIPRG